MKTVYYSLTKTAFGDVGVVWRRKNNTPDIVKICLPVANEETENIVLRSFPGAGLRSHGNVKKVCDYLLAYLAGNVKVFSFHLFDMSICTEFQRNVLNKACLIPRGMVSTYKGLAGRTGIPGGARAVGMALASNPFPLVIPCHRVIRTDGSLGGFGGGLEMKKKLLGIEGVVFNERGKVSPQFLWL
jgi:methylated-DNA-[protein]-cysteine S-methyltransferase